MQKYERTMLHCAGILVLACIFFIIKLNKDIAQLTRLQSLGDEFDVQVAETLNEHTKAIQSNQEYILLNSQ